MKTCTRCKKQKPVNEFYKNRSQKDGLANQCSDCAKEVQQEIYSRNPEKYRAKTKEYLAKHGDEQNRKRRENRREIYVIESARRYKSTPDRVRELLQITACEICKRPVSFDSENVHLRPNIDHNHANNDLRGLLCGYCNNLLGRAFDDPQILIKAAQYLDERGYKCTTS